MCKKVENDCDSLQAILLILELVPALKESRPECKALIIDFGVLEKASRCITCRHFGSSNHDCRGEKSG